MASLLPQEILEKINKAYMEEKVQRKLYFKKLLLKVYTTSS